MLGLADSVNFARDSLGPACLERDADIRFINIHFFAGVWFKYTYKSWQVLGTVVTFKQTLSHRPAKVPGDERSEKSWKVR